MTFREAQSMKKPLSRALLLSRAFQNRWFAPKTYTFSIVFDEIHPKNLTVVLGELEEVVSEQLLKALHGPHAANTKLKHDFRVLYRGDLT